MCLELAESLFRITLLCHCMNFAAQRIMLPDMLLPSSFSAGTSLAVALAGIPGLAFLLLTAVLEVHIPGLLPAVPRQIGLIRL